MFFKYLLFQEKLSIGVSLVSGKTSYALVHKDRSGRYSLVSSGKTIPVWLRYVIPMLVHTDMSNVPVIISKENIGNKDPDEWIEHQESCQDNGFPEDMNVTTEYAIDKTTVYKVIVSYDGLDTLIKTINNECGLITISAPLWNMAALYWSIIGKPFLLWKISKDGSVFGKVDNGRVERICNFWPDTLDIIEKKNEQIIDEISVIISSMNPEKTPVFVFSPEKDFSIPSIFINSGLGIKMAPEIKGVPKHDHENFALACQLNKELNFYNCEANKSGNLIRKVWEKSFVFTRLLIIILVSSTVLLFCIEHGCNIYVHLNKERLTAVKNQMESLKKTGVKLDSVITKFKEKAGYIADESKITNLLSELQKKFPEGLKAEEITLLDDTDKKYRIDIRAVASNSALIGTFMSKIQEIPSVSGCRLEYSEQIPVTQGEKGIRFKIQAFWK